MSRDPIKTITPHKLRLIRLRVDNGFSYKEIANKLGLSVKTVEIHFFDIYKYYGITNSMQLSKLYFSGEIAGTK